MFLDNLSTSILKLCDTRRLSYEAASEPVSYTHLTGSELKELADYLKSLDGETRVVMEHTGRYYEPVARFLHEEGVFVSAVNPKLIKFCLRFSSNKPIFSKAVLSNIIY